MLILPEVFIFFPVDHKLPPVIRLIFFVCLFVF